MSFMFNPYPYVDANALNTPELTEEIVRSVNAGNEKIAKHLLGVLPDHGILLLDGYAAADFKPLIEFICSGAPGKRISIRNVEDVYKSQEELDAMLAETLPQDRDIDPVLLFGKSMHRTIETLFDERKTIALAEDIGKARLRYDLTILYGCGSTIRPLRPLGNTAVFLDVTPLSATLRIRARKAKALGDTGPRKLSETFRRLYYYDYEIMMLHRQELLDFHRIDYYIDNNLPDNPKMIPEKFLWKLFDIQCSSPFRCTPAYIEGVWGGYYVKKLRSLPDDMKNCAWVFDMIPNEVSLQIRVGNNTLNIPFSTFFKAKPRQIMGEASVERFGRVFPVRFNYDDTYGGTGNMSVQVHPPQRYNQENFGEPFQQDESYYVVKTAGSKTYLGLHDSCNTEEFFQCIDNAEKKSEPFDYRKYVNSFSSTAGDQFLLPGGTIHASGRNQVVLEIGSYTIGSYTFKLYDYLRRDLDGNPRPIHSRHGKNVLNTECRFSRINGILNPPPRIVRQGNTWKEEVIGEHEKIYFSLRRLSFEHSVEDHTNGCFHVLVLVEGDEVLVCSKKDPGRFYRQKHMDMVVVPADIGEYYILNLGKTPCKVTKTTLK